MINQTSFEELEKQTGKLVTKFSYQMEEFIRSDMPDDMFRLMKEENKPANTLHSIYNRYHLGERSVFLHCKWILKEGYMVLHSYNRLTCDEYLDKLLEIRKQRKQEAAIDRFRNKERKPIS